jgi:hypothetical protein
VAETQEDAVEDWHEAEDEEEEEEVTHLRQQVRLVPDDVVRRVELVQTILVGLILSLSISKYSDESTRGNGHKIEMQAVETRFFQVIKTFSKIVHKIKTILKTF